MEVVSNVKNISRAEWLQLRQTGIGGSDAGAILGVNKWKTPFQIFLDKTELIEDQEQSEAAYWGNTLEDLVAREFMKRTGKKVRRNNRMLRSSQYPWMLANLDREVVGEQAILECKTANAYAAKDWDGDEIPAAYIIQVQHYLAVTGYEIAYLAVLIGGQKFIWKEINRDEELINIIVEQERFFWHEHVLKNIPPALDGSSAAEKFLKTRFAVCEPGTSIDLRSEFNDRITELLAIKENIKRLETSANVIENMVKNELQNIEQGFTPNYQITWKNVSSALLDQKALKAAHPDIVKKFTKESLSRRFGIKPIKANS